MLLCNNFSQKYFQNQHTYIHRYDIIIYKHLFLNHIFVNYQKKDTTYSRELQIILSKIDAILFI